MDTKILELLEEYFSEEFALVRAKFWLLPKEPANPGICYCMS